MQFVAWLIIQLQVQTESLPDVKAEVFQALFL